MSRAFVTDEALDLIPRLNLVFEDDGAQSIGLKLPVAVINLDRRPDKWAAICARMEAVGLDRLIRVPGIDGGMLSLEAIAPLLHQPLAQIEAPPQSHFSLTRPAVGCFLSHVALWRWQIASKLPHLLVFEDDANPCAGFDPARFLRVMSAVMSSSRMALMGSIIMNGMAERPDGSDLARIYFFNGTFAYVMTPSAAERLIHELLPMNGHIDHEISTILVERRHDFETVYASPPFFDPDWALGSDCYVPLEGVVDADDALGAVLHGSRRILLDEARPLLPAFREAG